MHLTRLMVWRLRSLGRRPIPPPLYRDWCLHPEYGVPSRTWHGPRRLCIRRSAYPEGLTGSGRDYVGDDRPICGWLPEEQAHFLVAACLDAELVSNAQSDPW